MASSTSTILAIMERPGRKPLCLSVMCGASTGSTVSLTALASRRLEVLVMFNGRTPPGS